MAFTVVANADPIHPGVMRVAVHGTPGDTFDLWRQEYINGPRHRVRGAINLTVPANGILQVYDTEAPLESGIRYQVESPVHSVWSPLAYAASAGNKAVIRSILNPLIKYQVVTIADETDIQRASRTTLYPVLSKAGPIAVGDERRLESSTITFVADDILHADRIIDVFQEGEPVLLRTPCTSLIRDKIVTGLNYQEVRYGRRGYRLCIFDIQQIDWPDDHPEVPIIPPGSWTYGQMRTNAATRYPTYDDIATPDPAENYLDLAVSAFGP